MCVHKDIVPGMHPLTHVIVHMKHTHTHVQWHTPPTLAHMCAHASMFHMCSSA